MKYIQVNQQLQGVLSQEIHLRREILGNMNQQEYALLSGNIEWKKNAFRQCHKCVVALKKVIKKRGILTRKLIDLMPADKVKKTLKDTLNPSMDLEWETLYLYQKVQELIDKIHFQHLRIKSLDEGALKKQVLVISSSKMHLPQTQRKKAMLITMDFASKNSRVG